MKGAFLYCTIALMAGVPIFGIAQEKISVRIPVDSFKCLELYDNSVDDLVCWNINNIKRFNYVTDLLGLDDSINVYRDGSESTGLYVGKSFALNTRNINEPGLLRMWRTEGHGTEHFFAESYYDEQKQRQISLDIKSDGSYIKMQCFLDGTRCDEYIEASLSGIIVERGFYSIKDSSYTDTISVIDPLTYEEMTRFIPRSTIGIKCGTWISQSSTGVLDTIRYDANCYK